MTQVSTILSAIEAGDAHAAEQLLPLVYEELRQLAARKLAHEQPGQTLQATALVHEAYLRLIGADGEVQWKSRGHFFAAAAEAMRRILVDSARRKKTEKHGGGRLRVALSDLEVASPGGPKGWLLLDEALTAFVHEDPCAAEIAKLRLFAGLSIVEAGKLVGISRATAFRHWTYARAWLQARLLEADKTE